MTATNMCSNFGGFRCRPLKCSHLHQYCGFVVAPIFCDFNNRIIFVYIILNLKDQLTVCGLHG